MSLGLKCSVWSVLLTGELNTTSLVSAHVGKLVGGTRVKSVVQVG